jgi:hypothetical protein
MPSCIPNPIVERIVSKCLYNCTNTGLEKALWDCGCQGCKLNTTGVLVTALLSALAVVGGMVLIRLIRRGIRK